MKKTEFKISISKNGVETGYWWFRSLSEEKADKFMGKIEDLVKEYLDYEPKEKN